MNDLLHAISATDDNRYDWGTGCLGWHLLEQAHMQVRQEWMPPGGRETPHRHGRAHQFFYVLSGCLHIETPGRTIVLAARQGAHVPPGVVHTASNASADGVHFLVFSSPSTQGDRVDTAAG